MSIKLDDIAKELDLSIMTISRALNDTGHVNAQTKKKIIETAEKIGYVPNIIAKNLALNKSNDTIGLIISNINNPFYAKLTYAVQKEALKCGFSIMLFNTNEELSSERKALSIIKENRCSGALISSVGNNEDFIKKCRSSSFPIIMVTRESMDNDLDFYGFDLYKGAYLATSHILSRGHKKIAHIAGPLFLNSVQEKIRGYIDALTKHNAKISKDYIIETEITKDGGYNATKELISKNTDITAILIYCDWMAIGVLKALRELNKKVPEDISLVSFDNIEILSFLNIFLTSVDLPINTVARNAVETIVEKIKTHTVTDRIYKSFKPELIIRESVKTI